MLSRRQIIRTPLPGLAGKPATRFVLRLTLFLSRRLFGEIEGEERLRESNGPLIVALNHNQYLEAILVPGILTWKRSGHLVHFLADWNFLLIPIVRTLFRLGEIIPVKRKAARPRFLTSLRDRMVKEPYGFALARQYLAKGKWVGVFPEGRVNSSRSQLLRGYRGAARLSLKSGVPILPVGIRFPGIAGREKVPAIDRMSLHVGSLILPEPFSNEGPPGLHALHTKLMNTLSALSEKNWQPKVTKKPC